MSALERPRGPRFWSWSLNIYLKPVVADICLKLQDEDGADVNIILWCCWLAQKGFSPLDPDLLLRARRSVAPLQSGLTKPLRTARHSVKELDELLSEEDRRGLRARILEAELEAERLEQGLLDRLAEAACPRADGTARTDREHHKRVARANLALYFRQLGQDPDSPSGAHKLNQLLGAVFSG